MKPKKKSAPPEGSDVASQEELLKDPSFDEEMREKACADNPALAAYLKQKPKPKVSPA